MGVLGLYFGPKAINIVEAKGKRILKTIRIPTSVLSGAGLEDKVPEEIKLVALFKEELRKNQIDSREVTIALSGLDLIIRTFEIPLLPARELAGAVYFEAKKYIPFKIEDLISDFQVRLVQGKRVYLVMFMGIRIETLEKYFSILSQCDISIKSIEYSAFSILRLIELCGFREKGTIGVINFDSAEEEEADFTVIENGFPVFGRDMRFSTRTAEISHPSEDKGMILEKLKTEIRISLDYYTHKFPVKKIEKMFFVGNPNIRSALEDFAHKLDLTFGYIDPAKIAGVPPDLSMGLLKAYSSALSAVIKTKVTVNILSAWEKTERLKELSGKPKDLLAYLFTDLKIDPRIVVLALMIGAAGFVFGLIQKKPLEAELKQLVVSQPADSSAVSYDELKEKEGSLNAQIAQMNNILKNQLYLTPLLSAVSQLMPEEGWLQDFVFTGGDKPQLTLRGMAYFNDNNRELEAVQDFLKLLQNDQRINKTFKDPNLLSIDTVNFKGKKVTSFTIAA